MTRVLVADPSPGIRGAIAAIVQLEECITLIGQGEAEFETISLCHELSPDIVILELEWACSNCLRTLKWLRHSQRFTKVVINTGSIRRDWIRQAFEIAPEGFLHKTEFLDQFMEALRAVMGGATYASPKIASLAAADGSEKLTTRENLIVQMVAKGQSSKEIACHLGISVRTVDNHRASIMRKLDLRDAVSLTHFAIRAGIMDLPSMGDSIKREIAEMAQVG